MHEAAFTFRDNLYAFLFSEHMLTSKMIYIVLMLM